MRWTTGYPFGVNLCRGYPRFNPGEFSTVDLLVRGDNDAALVLGADPGATMPQPAIDHLARIPTIVLDPKVTHTSRLARVHITTAVTGISAPGTVYRMDEIPLPLRPALKSPYPTDEEVIRRISQAVAAKPPLVPARLEPPLTPGADGPEGNQAWQGIHAADHGGKVYDPANGVNGDVRDVCMSGWHGRRRRRRGRAHHRRDGHGGVPRRRGRPHARRRRGADLVAAQSRHPRAPPRLVLGQPLCLQDAQRLAHRQPARAEALGDLLLADPLPRADVAGQDRLAQEVRDPGAGRPLRYVDRVGAVHEASSSVARSNALPPG